MKLLKQLLSEIYTGKAIPDEENPKINREYAVTFTLSSGGEKKASWVYKTNVTARNMAWAAEKGKQSLSHSFNVLKTIGYKISRIEAGLVSPTPTTEEEWVEVSGEIVAEKQTLLQQLNEKEKAEIVSTVVPQAGRFLVSVKFKVGQAKNEWIYTTYVDARSKFQAHAYGEYLVSDGVKRLIKTGYKIKNSHAQIISSTPIFN
jgi:2C-methyl-D-erythritol 2,4-cyclodiphosphate synthase